MQVKRYEVSGISEALIKIKEDLGPDAIILSAKKIKGPGNSAIEVMAARDEKVGLPSPKDRPAVAAWRVTLQSVITRIFINFFMARSAN